MNKAETYYTYKFYTRCPECEESMSVVAYEMGVRRCDCGSEYEYNAHPALSAEDGEQ